MSAKSFAGLREDLVAKRFEARAQRGIARRETRASERLVLPRPRALLLVLLERRDRAHEQSRCAVGAKSQIGFVEDAGRGVAREPRAHALREAPELLRGRRALFVVQEDDVEVRSVAQLLAAELAVSDDDEARDEFVTRAQSDAGRGLLHRYREHRIRQRRQLVRQRHHRELIFDVRDGEAQHVPLLEVAQVIQQALEVRRELRALRA